MPEALTQPTYHHVSAPAPAQAPPAPTPPPTAANFEELLRMAASTCLPALYERHACPPARALPRLHSLTYVQRPMRLCGCIINLAAGGQADAIRNLLSWNPAQH